MQTEWNWYWRAEKDVWITHFCWSNGKLPGWEETSRENSRVVPRHGRTCSKMRSGILRAGKQKCGAVVHSPEPLLGWSPIQEGRTWIRWRITKSMLTNWLKCLYLARIGRPDTLWYVNKLEKWTQACDRRLARLISYIHHANDYRQDSKSTSERVSCIIGSRTFVTTSLMCKKQTTVSYSSSESEIISLDAGLRMDGLLALDLWDVVIELLHSTNNTPFRLAPWNSCGTGNHSSNKTKTTTPTSLVIDRERSNRDADQLSSVYIFEDNEAVIKMTIKGRSPTMRHVSRKHRVALDWLSDRINL